MAECRNVACSDLYSRFLCLHKEVIHKVKGSMAALSALQLTAQMEGLDTQSKVLLHSKEVLAVILQGVVSEYQGYSRQEIMEFIETDSIVDGKEVSLGRTNTQIRGDATEFVQLNEKISHFDVAFRAKNPLVTRENVLVNLHVDVEPQKSYQPGYPIEKRGIYYLARSLSSQMSLVTEMTNYIDFSDNEELWKEAPNMTGLGLSIYEEGIETGIQTGIEALIRYNLMEGISKEKIIENLKKFFGLTEEKSEQYY